MRGRLTALSLLAGILVPASSALAADPHVPTEGSSGIGIRLVDVPSDARDDLRARSYIVDRLAPGTTIRRRVEISNSTRSTADVAVYPAAASLRGGEFGFAPGHSRNELSSWTLVSQDVLRLPPGAKALETVTVDVPSASSGERYGVIWAEVAAPAPAEGGVMLVNRVGIRMYVSIGPGGAVPSNFAIVSLAAKRSASGEPRLVARIHNSGARTIDVSGDLRLAKGPGGLRAGPFAVKLESALAPDDSKPVTVRLDRGLPRGPWRAHLRLKSGLVQRVAVATITFPRHVGAAKPPTARVASVESRHLILAITLLALLAAVAPAFLILRRSRRERGDFEPAATAR